MQIIPFPAHYQSVYTNFDISSFSLISCLSTKAEPQDDWIATASSIEFLSHLDRKRWPKHGAFFSKRYEKYDRENGHSLLHVFYAYAYAPTSPQVSGAIAWCPNRMQQGCGCCRIVTR